jgi:hypothetical protein
MPHHRFEIAVRHDLQTLKQQTPRTCPPSIAEIASIRAAAKVDHHEAQ